MVNINTLKPLAAFRLLIAYSNVQINNLTCIFKNISFHVGTKCLHLVHGLASRVLMQM